ncbi:MAG TPA: winged helix-turn-helix domain-containing protein [Rhodothermales bacterium]|nr:winged helix-turn-helix domain-containing protein [Rhodothermales bacterium]
MDLSNLHDDKHRPASAAPSALTGAPRFAFGPFLLLPTERLLLHHDTPVDLDPKAFDTLVLLARHSGNLLSKEHLMEALWPDTVVDENYLSVNISKVRAALGETARGWRYVETVRGHGYRFHGTIDTRLLEETAPTSAETIIARRTRTYLTIEEDLDSDEPRGILQPGPRTRYPSAGVVLASLTLVLLAGAAWLLSRDTPGADEAARARTMAVLPLAPLHPSSAAPAPDSAAYLGLGLADALITKLSNLDALLVRPTSAVTRFARTPAETAATDPVTAGRDLQVEAVLQGHVQQTGERLRVTLQLVDVASGQTRWSGSFDEAFTDVFAVQEAIASQVARALALELDPAARRRLATRETEHAEAYRSYLKGRYFWNKRTGVALAESRHYFEEALDLDPTYARAWAGLADAYALLGNFGAMKPSEAYPRARQAATQALQLDSTLADAHTVLALTLRDYYWDWHAAAHHFRQAVRFGPNNATAHHQYAVEYLSVMGHHEEAIERAEQAAFLDPLSLMISADLGRVYYAARQPDRAIAQLEETLSMNPDFFMARLYLGIAYLQKGWPERAIPIFERARQASGDSLGPNPNTIAYHGVALARAGREAEARQALNELYTLKRKRYVPPYWLGFLHGNLGEMDRAFAWLDSAYAHRNLHLIYLKDSPMLSDFRHDDRATNLLERMGL